MTNWYSLITFGYSDSEDRLWVRLTAEDSNATFWLSRRLVSRLLADVYGGLVGDQSREATWLEHEKAVTELRAQGGDSSPPAPKLEGLLSLGLIATIRFSQHEASYSMVFEGNGGSAGLRCDRTAVHRILEALWSRQRAVGWGLAAPWVETLVNDQ
ncbi:MAG: hypothetical protein O2881_04550 [Proteobacteria bacterium]|nr:hypothetical protein [Pseudomonadota bacterium]